MNIAILDVLLDLGAGIRGTDMGPRAIHVAGLVPALERLGHLVTHIERYGVPDGRVLDEGGKCWERLGAEHELTDHQRAREEE